MASSIIHIVVANEINKKLDRDYHKVLIGSIAPDISKLLGKSKKDSHFYTKRNNFDVPDLEKFLELYKNNIDDDFVLGYYIHLYTDYLWFKYFLPEIYDNDLIKKIDGKVYKATDSMLRLYLYSDYSNLNVQIIDKYKLDISFLYKPVPEIKHIIKEIPIDQLHIMTEKTAEFLEKDQDNKKYLFDLKEVEKFIKTSTDLILASLNELGIK